MVADAGFAGTIKHMKNTPPITLLTDFGTSDAYVGTMKGVMRSICPHATFIDLTHTIAPQNVRQAAYVLLTAYRHFPPDTVFLVVVDPGVGSARAPFAVQTDHGMFVAPDNGVLSYVLARVNVTTIVELDNPDYHWNTMSNTFHGRDIFSPAAAHLAHGVPIEQFGTAMTTWQTLPAPTLTIEPGIIRGEVLHVDHFGNVITSIGNLTWVAPDTLHLTPEFGDQHPDDIAPINTAACRIEIGEHRFDTINHTYSAVAPGDITVLVGSSGQLEIGQNQGSAARTLNLAPGTPVTLQVTG